jgi:hypothetical protein
MARKASPATARTIRISTKVFPVTVTKGAPIGKFAPQDIKGQR